MSLPTPRYHVWEGAGQALLVDRWVLCRVVDYGRPRQPLGEVLPRLRALCDRLNEVNERALR